VKVKSSLNERIDFYGLQKMAPEFPKIAKAMKKYAPTTMDEFYKKVRANSETYAHFSSEEQINTAKTAQLQHWQDIFELGLNENYAERAAYIGDVHARIGLEPKWYIGGYATILADIIESIMSSSPFNHLPGQRGLAKTITTLGCTTSKVGSKSVVSKWCHGPTRSALARAVGCPATTTTPINTP